jgi:hypothetical protein
VPTITGTVRPTGKDGAIAGIDTGNHAANPNCVRAFPNLSSRTNVANIVYRMGFLYYMCRPTHCS